MRRYLALGYLERDMITVIGIFTSKKKAVTATQNYITTNGWPWECSIESIELDKEIDRNIG